MEGNLAYQSVVEESAPSLEAKPPEGGLKDVAARAGEELRAKDVSRRKSEKAGTKAPEAEAAKPTPKISQTIRFDEATMTRLRVAAVERKNRYMPLDNQQAIVNQATMEWLERNGY